MQSIINEILKLTVNKMCDFVKHFHRRDTMLICILTAWGNVIFSVCPPLGGGGGGVAVQSLHHWARGSPRLFLRSVIPPGWTGLGYSWGKTGLEYPPGPGTGLGYPLGQDRTGVTNRQDRTGVPLWPGQDSIPLQAGQDWDTPPPPPPRDKMTERVLAARRAACLVQFPAGGLSCCFC